VASHSASKKPAPHYSASNASVSRKTPRTGASSTATHRPASSSTVAATSGSKTKTSKKPVTAVARRSSQQQPTQDRYLEIQQALAEKGYFAGQPDGNWGPESVEALKRFQSDQNLTQDGKLGSLSLIAMGLGPKRMAPAESSAETAPPEKSEKQFHNPSH
jgi:peptidoglycan hydrolase-like protein with peptidoglycan-binding domain